MKTRNLFSESFFRAFVIILLFYFWLVQVRDDNNKIRNPLACAPSLSEKRLTGEEVIDLMVIVAYFLVMLIVGWRTRRQSAESFWIAERRYLTGPVTLSLVATIFGASSTMGIIGLGYCRGLTGAWWSLIGGVALIPFAFLLAGRVRDLNVYTLPDILKKAYGERVAVPAGVMITVAWCGVIAAQLIAGARLVSSVFSFDFQWALVVVTSVFVLYTFWGGQLTVIKTDSWQFFLFLGGLLLCLAFLLLSQGMGRPLWQNISNDHWDFPVSSTFGWYDVLAFYPLIVGLPYLVGPDIYSRVLCAKNNRVARRSALLAAVVVIPLSFLLAFLGLLASAKLPGIAPEAALPQMLSVFIPPGITGFIAAGFLGAIMSSADTCLISAATILSLNVVGPFWRLSKGKQLRLTRAAVLAIGLTAWLIASRQQEIIASLLLGYTVFVGGVVLPTLATFRQQWLKITSSGALWAIVAGGGAAILGKIHGGAPMKAILTKSGAALIRLLIGPQYLSILPIILCLVVMVGISRMTRS